MSSPAPDHPRQISHLAAANAALDEVRRAEFFGEEGSMRGLVKGNRWLLLSRWVHLDADKKRQLNQLFALNRRVVKAYLLKENLRPAATPR